MARFSTCLVRLVAVGLASFHVYTGYFGTFYPYVQRSIPGHAGADPHLPHDSRKQARRGEREDPAPRLGARAALGPGDRLRRVQQRVPGESMADDAVVRHEQRRDRMRGDRLAADPGSDAAGPRMGARDRRRGGAALHLPRRAHTDSRAPPPAVHVRAHARLPVHDGQRHLGRRARGGGDLHRAVHHLRRVRGEGGRLPLLHRLRQRDRRPHQGRAGEGRDRVLGDDRLGHRDRRSPTSTPPVNSRYR